MLSAPRAEEKSSPIPHESEKRLHLLHLCRNNPPTEWASTHGNGTMNSNNIPLSIEAASRAVGAMFFTVFGTAWLALWAMNAYQRPWSALLPIACFACLLFSLALQRYTKYRVLTKRMTPIYGDNRKSMGFFYINAIQWLSIAISVVILTGFGKISYIPTAVIAIVGAHFLPLARLFNYPPHYMTGAALLACASVSALTHTGQTTACLATGLILWGSALWALCSRGGHPSWRST